MSSLSIAILAGLGGMLGWGFADFFAKKTIDEIGSIVSLVWAHLFGTIILVILAVLQLVFFKRLIYIPSTLFEWGGLIFFGVLQMVVYYLVYEGFGKGQVAVLNPIFASFAGLVAIGSVVIFRETVGGNLAVSLIFLFAGILFLNLDIKGLRAKHLTIVPGLREVGAATLLAAIWTLGWDKFVSHHDFLSYALFMYLFMTVAAFMLSRIMKVKVGASTVKFSLWKFLLLIGVGETIAYLGISLGYSQTSFTSVVALISGAFSLPTIILARMFLKEKVTLIQTIGSVIIIIGVIILAIH